MRLGAIEEKIDGIDGIDGTEDRPIWGKAYDACPRQEFQSWMMGVGS